MDDLVKLLKVLHDGGVEFVVVGGLAAVAHGSPVVTLDVDVCTRFDDANLHRILDALAPHRPRLVDRPDMRHMPSFEQLQGVRNLYLNTELGKVDLLGELPGVCSYADLANRFVSLDLGGFICRVVDLDTLIEAKKVAGRPKDQFALLHLEAIRKIRRQQPGLFET